MEPAAVPAPPARSAKGGTNRFRHGLRRRLASLRILARARSSPKAKRLGAALAAAAAGREARRCEEAWVLPGNFVPDACKGCVVVHGSHPAVAQARLTTRHTGSPFQWNPEDKAVVVANSSYRRSHFTFVSFSGASVLNARSGEPFPTGGDRPENGAPPRAVTTFVVVARPRRALRLGRFDASAPGADVFAFPMEPLVAARASHSGAALCPEPPPLAFPLPEASGPYLCTQGVGGHLTHFFAASFHALDLRCPLRTEVLAVGDGIVREVAERHTCGGIHVANLTTWNAVSLELDCGFVAEYVHVLPGSARVQVGEAVRRGQVICESGDIGFAPEPHLHIELHRKGEREGGPSVPLRFAAMGEGAFVPVAGRWYSPGGEVPPPEAPPLPAAGWRCPRRAPT